MTGTRGPMGKRSEDRRRRNKPENEGRPAITTGEGNFDFEIPEPDESWHPMVVDLYESLADSGESDWFQPSDWMAARILCESMSRDLKPQFVGFQDRVHPGTQQMEHLPTKMSLPLKGGNLTAYLRLFGTLGVTEGDRRRMGIELQKAAVDPEAIADATVVDARKRFTG